MDVLAVAPAPVHTGFADRAGMTMGAAATPDQVARNALKGLGRRGTVIPGSLAKALTFALLTAPRTVRVRITQRIRTGLRSHASG